MGLAPSHLRLPLQEGPESKTVGPNRFNLQEFQGILTGGRQCIWPSIRAQEHLLPVSVNRLSTKAFNGGLASAEILSAEFEQ